MRSSLFHGPALLLLWQVVPVAAERDSAGKVQVVFGFGAGQFEQRQLACDGTVLSADAVPFTVAGALVDAWPANDVRVSASGGVMASGGRTTGFGGFQVAIEGRGAGAGFGAAGGPWSAMDPNLPNVLVPSVYLRLGSRDRAHFRLDGSPLTPTPGATGDMVRMGLGYNRGPGPAPRWFVGFSSGPFADEAHSVGLFAEAEFPVGRRLDLGLGASWRSSETNVDASAQMGMRYHFPR